MKKKTMLVMVLLAALIGFGVTGPAHANLTAMGPIDPTDGFPAFYTDANGLTLLKCNVENLYSPNVVPRVLPSNDPGTAPTWMCTLNSTAGISTCPPVGSNTIVAGCYNDMQPIDPVGFKNFPFETFYFNATISDALCPGAQCPNTLPGNIIGTSKRALLYLAAVEATFVTPTGAPPILPPPNTNASVFQRIRIDLDIPVTGTYVVKHPYPTGLTGPTEEIFASVPAGTRAVKFTANYPAAGVPFDLVKTGPIGPFLRTAATEGGAPVALYGATDALGVPIRGKGFIGDPNLKPGVPGSPPMTVTGSPVNQNFVSVCGPDPGCSVVNYRQNQFQLMGMVNTRAKKLIDFDGDGKTDISIYRVGTGAWFIIPSSTGVPTGTGFGGDPADIPVAGDYDGDGKADVAVYRPTTGAWFIVHSLTGTPIGIGFGGDPSDIPVPGDYDGDGKTDLAIYRKSTGAWFVYPSLAGIPGIYGVGFGGDPSDKPVPADYDGDGKTDIAIYRASTGAWFIYPSSVGAAGIYGVGWGGAAGDLPVPGDYDGDGKDDIAFYRPTDPLLNWFVVPSSTGIPYGVKIGGDPTDKPVTGDFDNDGKTDIGVYRTGTGFWYIIHSTGGPTSVTGFGGDLTDLPPVTPIPAMF